MTRGRSAAFSLTLLAVSLVGREGSAQNTYADVPFNQGSLFYRPSGAKLPKKTTSTPKATTSARPFRWFYRPRAATVPATTMAPRYYVPTTPRVVAPTPGTSYAYPPTTAPAR